MNPVRLMRDRGRDRGQDGFALATTILVLLVTSILVTAMLGLTFATTTNSGRQVTRDSESRASDAAIEAAVGIVARAEPEPTTGFLLGQVGSEALTTSGVADPCNWVPGAGELEGNRPKLVDSESDGLDVEVFCTALAADRVTPVTRSEATVSVLGRAPAQTWWNQADTPGACQPLTECLPWREALAQAGRTADAPLLESQLAPGANRNGIGVVHGGTDPLLVVGNLDVSGGVAAARNPERPASGDYVVEPPAVSVSGGFRQGDPGLLADAGDACGILAAPADGVAAVDQVPGAEVQTGTSISCDQDDLQATTATRAGVVPASKVNWTSAEIRNQDVTADPARFPAGLTGWGTDACPVGAAGAVQFRPGAYPANITARLNAWFRNCVGVRFWFPPGNYWFDSNTSGNALVMERAQNLYVFGTPNTGAETIAAVTRVTAPMCRPDRPGVHLTLSPRTSIRHTSGSVAICGKDARTDPTAQAIWQAPTANLGFGSTAPTTFSGLASSTPWYANLQNIFLVGSLLNLIFGPPQPNQTTYTSLPSGGLNMTTTCASSPCTGTVAFSTTWNPATPASDPGPAPVSSATLRITAQQSRANDIYPSNQEPVTEVAVYKPNPATGALPAVPSCRLRSPRINDNFGAGGPATVDIELIGPGSPCGESIDRADLLRSKIEVAMGLNSDCALGLITGCTMSVSVSRVQLETAQVLTSPREATPSFVGGTSGGGQQSNAQNAATPDGSFAQFNFNRTCGFSIFVCLFWNISDGGTGTIRVPSLTDRYSPNLADSDPSLDAPLTGASLKVKGISFCRNGFLNVDYISRDDCTLAQAANASGARVRVAVRRGASVICEASFDRLPEWNQTRSYDLRNGCLQGGVRRLNYNRDLVGVDLDVAFDMRRDDSLGTGCRPNLLGFFCDQWGYRVDYIGVATTVATAANQSFDGPAGQFLVSSNDRANANRDARLNVWGAAILPRADVKVEWVGPANALGDPVVTGPPTQVPGGPDNLRPLALQVNSLTSVQIQPPGSSPTTRADDARAGIICCERGRPAERQVELRAHAIPPSTKRFALPLGGANTVNLNCTTDNPTGVTVPAAVGGAAAAAAWKAQVVEDWVEVCRTNTLRATALLRVVDQIPIDIEPPPRNSQSVFDKRGTFVPGWDVDMRDYRSCRGGDDELACTPT